MAVPPQNRRKEAVGQLPIPPFLKDALTSDDPTSIAQPLGIGAVTIRANPLGHQMAEYTAQDMRKVFEALAQGIKDGSIGKQGLDIFDRIAKRGGVKRVIVNESPNVNEPANYFKNVRNRYTSPGDDAAQAWLDPDSGTLNLHAVDSLGQERAANQLWANAQHELTHADWRTGNKVPQAELDRLRGYVEPALNPQVRAHPQGPLSSPEELAAYATSWAAGMPREQLAKALGPEGADLVARLWAARAQASPFAQYALAK
jgi:hypothetical protein